MAEQIEVSADPKAAPASHPSAKAVPAADKPTRPAEPITSTGLPDDPVASTAKVNETVVSERSDKEIGTPGREPNVPDTAGAAVPSPPVDSATPITPPVTNSGLPEGMMAAIPKASEIVALAEKFELSGRSDKQKHLDHLEQLLKQRAKNKWDIGDELQLIDPGDSSVRKLAAKYKVGKSMLSEMQNVAASFPPRERSPALGWWEHAKALRALATLKKLAKELGEKEPKVEPVSALRNVKDLGFSPNGIAAALAKTYAPALLDEHSRLKVPAKRKPVMEVGKLMLPMFVTEPTLFGRDDYWGVVVAKDKDAALRILGGRTTAKTAIALKKVGYLQVKPGQYLVRAVGDLPVGESKLYALADAEQGTSPLVIEADEEVVENATCGAPAQQGQDVTDQPSPPEEASKAAVGSVSDEGNQQSPFTAEATAGEQPTGA